MVEPGRRCLGDRYELDRLIAAGGMGQVWRAQDIALHRPVAVKVLRSEYTGDPTFVARFRAEAQHAASLNHPNTAAVFDYGEATAEDGTGETLAYLVMELVEGEPLSALLGREGRLDTATTLSILRQTAFALAEAHRAGMVHRDVKPGNIMVRPDGSVKITDFGIAWSARSVALTRTGQVIGTPQYLSPEQAEGKHATPASDVYALGLIGYECLVGHPAFEGDNAVTIAVKQVQQEPEPLPGTLPEDVRELICRALHKDPAARYADGAAFVEAIEAVIEGRPLPEAPSTIAVARVASPPPPPRSASADPTTGPGAAAAVPSQRTSAAHSVVRPPAPRRRGRLAMVLLPLLGLLAGAGIAAALFQALAGDGPGSPAVAADQQEQTGTTVTIDADDYIGRPVEEVVDELTGLGLDVERRQVPTDDAVPGSVTDVAPDGVLQQEDTVVVSYAVAPGSGRRSDDGTGVTGAAVEPQDDTSSAATPTDEAEPTDAATGGDTSELPGEPVDTSVVTEPTETTTESTPTDTTTTETTTTETTTSTSNGVAEDANTVDGAGDD